MTPYKRVNQLGEMENYHNYCLSADRVAIENVFGIIKGRWRRLQYINTYSIAKAIEITTAVCILHNYCYLNSDEWNGEICEEIRRNEDFIMDNRQETQLGKRKRDEIARQLYI